MRAHEQDDKAHLNKTVDILVKLRVKMEKLQNDNNMLREETTKLTKENGDRLVKIQNELAVLSREKDDQLEDKVARSEVKMRAETARSLKDKEDKLNKAIDMNKTSLNRMKYIVIAVVILLVAVGYPLFNHYDLQTTLQQQKSLQATLQ